MPDGVALELGIRVRHHQDVALGERHQPAEDSGLAAALCARELHPARPVPLDDGVGLVGRGVGADQDLQLVRRIVLGEQVLDSPRDAILLVEGRDQDGDAGQANLGGRTATLVSAQVPPGAARLRDRIERDE